MTLSYIMVTVCYEVVDLFFFSFSSEDNSQWFVHLHLRTICDFWPPSTSREHVFWVDPWVGYLNPFSRPRWAFCINLLVPPWSIHSFPKKNARQIPRGWGMGTFRINLSHNLYKSSKKKKISQVGERAQVTWRQEPIDEMRDATISHHHCRYWWLPGWIFFTL